MREHILGTVERAFELAAGGRFAKVDELARALAAEGYPQAAAHLQGPGIRRELKNAMVKAQAAIAAASANASHDSLEHVDDPGPEVAVSARIGTPISRV